MSILETFQKNSTDVIDYDFDYSAWLTSRGGDSINSFSVTVPAGLYKGSTQQMGNIIRVFIGGGTIGQSYEVSCQINTSGGRAKQAKIRIFVS